MAEEKGKTENRQNTAQSVQTENGYAGRRSLLFVPFVLIMIFLVAAGFGVWKEYQDTLMDNQISQMRLSTELLSKTLKNTLDARADDLAYLSQLQNDADAEQLFQEYLDTHKGFVAGLFVESAEGRLLYSSMETRLEQPVEFLRHEQSFSLSQMSDPEGEKYLVMRYLGDAENSVCMAVNEQVFYNQLILQVQIGTNGYALIKSSDGTIIMHPSEDQWGIDVIEGRKAMYPELDYSSLEEMIALQKQGKAGVSEYYSYWWTDPELPRVRKIASYVPVYFGSDFLIVSAVTDYADFYEPIRQGFSRMLLVFLGIVLTIVVLWIIISRLLLRQQKMEGELVYVKELNALLEEVHRNEEVIAHQQRLQIMGTMTGGIAHEFNNFLTPIMGYAELLMMELPEDSDQHDSAREIYEASEKAKDVVRQISALSRRNVETVYKEVPAAKLMSRIVKMAEAICPPQISLTLESQLAEEHILGNSTQLNQVLLNMCVNAIHAIGKEEGQIRMTAGCVERAALDADTAGRLSDSWQQYIQVDVSDTGCGMDKEVMRQIFDPFYTTKQSGEGTGLGLALAEQIITSHKGVITVESEKGKGSCFHIFLPVMTEGTPQLSPEVRDHIICRVVIADDNAKLLKMLQRCFAKVPVALSTCMNREEAERALEKGADVLFADENFGDTSGTDFCMSISGRYPGLKKYVMAEHMTREIAELKKRGVLDGCVEKPVSETSILSCVYASLKPATP